jgi:hypothetical protein
MKGNIIRLRGKCLAESQQKFQKQLQEVLLLIRNQEEILVMSKDNEIDSKSEPKVEEPATKSLKTAFFI